MLLRLFTIALLLCLACPLPGEAADPIATPDLTALENIFSEVVLKDSPWPKEDVEIANFSVRPLAMTLPEGGFDYRITQKPNDTRPGKKNVTATILQEGQEQGQVRMSGDLRLFGTVVSTLKRLNRNEIVGESDVTAKRQDISMLDAGLIQDPKEAIGKKLKTSLPAGAILHAQALEAPTLVHRGERVTIMAKSQAIKITAPGEARNSGALGEMIRVKNLASRREIHARVTGAGLVEAEF
ncbi:MAG: flagellar basal body P-ring formation protein FlgA [Proteobacteria bacterium]|nr:flagellar basal body P-ring formation protein FlgA [Pseudomonadota bacterium]MBU1545976.1 flagellar basal body P-ring formation protein FlgA [Pseudomonadota bacterium]MBU2619428.1 flagellar basal body P-ring formation protein FlgA [Pseudomonadota bacterium]